MGARVPAAAARLGAALLDPAGARRGTCAGAGQALAQQLLSSRRARERLDAFNAGVDALVVELVPVGAHWVLVDDGLSRNGSFVNGERVVGRRVLRDGDRLCFGDTPVVYRESAVLGASSTIGVGSGPAAVQLTPTQRQILVALCRPVRDSAFAIPKSNREIAEEVSLSVDAVKAHLRTLFERFGLEGLPQNQKRARLAATALLQGIVTHRD